MINGTIHELRGRMPCLSKQSIEIHVASKEKFKYKQKVEYN